MARLIDHSPLDTALPRVIGACTLEAAPPRAITAMLAGPDAAPEQFRAATGVAFPAPGRATGRAGARAVWMGPDQCFWLGEPVGPVAGYAQSDQSDGWVVMRLSGADAGAVLARLVPIDLRPAVFRRGHTARSLLFHIPASITRVGQNAFDIMVFRSMAGSAVHDLTEAMISLAARRDLAGAVAPV